MSDRPRDKDWDAASWEGSRRAQLRDSLRLTVRERLEALETLAETSRHFEQMRKTGQFHYGDQLMERNSAIDSQVGETGGHYELGNSEGCHVVHLRGCMPTPLASYLKALAILRLVAEQKDPDARGWWEGEHFVLESVLDEEGLKRFFLDEYRPTPVIAPWNGGSGFYFREEKYKDPETGKNIKTGKRNQQTTATRAIDRLLQGKAERLLGLRECVKISKVILGKLSFEESPKERDAKNQLLNLLRAELPDGGLSSLDASILISNDNLMFPPLLGTGGTDGNLDFTNNFIQRLFDLIGNQDGKPAPAASALLINALFDDIAMGWENNAIGQFSPGQAGGPNAGTGYEAGSSINPWNFVLMIEGSLLFAAAATRRLGADGIGAMAFPFTVRPKGSGQGGLALSDEGASRAEIWLPLWAGSAGLESVKALFSEGRVALGRHGARDGLDFSRAVSTLAASRGINSFQRYAFMQRSGKAFLATPLNRFYVPRRPQQDLIGELDQWLWRFQSWARRDEAANHTKMLAHRLDDALFDLTRRGGRDCGVVQKVLITLGQIQRYAATSTSTRENIPPVPFLSERWFLAAQDNSPEFHIAAALAGVRSGNQHTMPMWAHLSPLDPNKYYPDWLPEGAIHHYYTWNHSTLEKNLVAVLEKRLFLAHKQGHSDKPLGGRFATDIAIVTAFLGGMTDDSRVGQLLAGLTHCKIPAKLGKSAGEEPPSIPAAYAVLKLLFVSNRQLRRCGLLAEMMTLPIPSGLIRLLATGRIQDALTLAQRQLRIAGLSTLICTPSVAGISGQRLAASLLFPLTDVAVWKLHRLISRRSAEQRQAS